MSALFYHQPPNLCSVQLSLAVIDVTHIRQIRVVDLFTWRQPEYMTPCTGIVCVCCLGQAVIMS